MLRKLEKYDVLEEIGHGGMATVYRARDTVLDRPVALKVMHPHLRTAEEARRRFHREARSVARLRHPRVLEIYDFSGEGSTEAYIAAELLTGPTLKQWREKQQDVPAEIAACFAIEIAKALECAHAANIVHRDVKPENVLLHEDRTIKLTDFGIADMIDAQSMTATGQILGSPGHMAPEQIEGKDCDARTDLFSLGTVLYYLATGRLPFTGRNPHQVLKRIVDGEYADPLRVNPTIGGRMRAIIVKTLAHDVADRYQSAREIIEELESFLAEAGIADSDQMLERYLQSPEKVGAEVRAQTIDHLIEHGARASDAGDVPSALDYYNRVLALDEGNERVLKLIERVGMDRRRRAMLMAGAGLMAFGAVTAVSAWALWPDPHVDDRRPIVGPIDTPALQDAGTNPRVAVLEGDTDAGDERAVLDASRSELAVAEPDAGQHRPRVAGHRERRTGPPRDVLFVSEFVHLRVGIDGAPPQPFRLGMHQELTPGRHTLRLEPMPEYERLHRATSQTFTLPPGEGRFELSLDALPFQPARIYVNTGAVRARVVAGRTRGWSNEYLSVPLDRPQQTLSIVVTADGYRPERPPPPQTLRAGEELPEIRVDLVPGAPIAAP